MLHPDQPAELAYLQETEALLESQLLSAREKLDSAKDQLKDLRRTMLEDDPNALMDMDRQAAHSQSLNILRLQETAFAALQHQIIQYQKMQDRPYFGRIDFQEEDQDAFPVYIGRGTLINAQTQDIQVYDWRAPISGLFYRHGPGPASYDAPDGPIDGTMTLKRQYDIRKGQLHFFFDTEVNILDEALIQALSSSASPKMRTIVETIQKAQDEIIRDTDSPVLMVQGAAGSGKTAVALHRVAYLMYQALKNPLSPRQVLFLSPSPLFGHYISQVLPELGEAHIQTPTFDQLLEERLPEGTSLLGRFQYSEKLWAASKKEEAALRRLHAFTSSPAMPRILENYVEHLLHQGLDLADFYYHPIYLARKNELKEHLQKQDRRIPLRIRLQHLQERLYGDLHQEKKKRMEHLESFVSQFPQRQLEVFPYARLLAMKRTQGLRQQIAQLDQLEASPLYEKLWQHPELFSRMAKGLVSVEALADLQKTWQKYWDPQSLHPDQAAALTYFKGLLEGFGSDPAIHQVLVDEVQDYGPLHLSLLRKWFPQARFTLLGDVNQALDHQKESHFYEDLAQALDLEPSRLLTLNQSFRSAYEITRFGQRLLPKVDSTIAFERHGTPPSVHVQDSLETLDETLAQAIGSCRKEGLASIAILCKTMDQARGLHTRLKQRLALTLIHPNSQSWATDSLVMPIYLAKGLEFDAVLVYDASEAHYHTEDDRRLLYIASSRALHHLAFYSQGPASPFLKD